MTANELIDLSRVENRTVTEYPETPDEYAALTEDLLCESDGSADHSGAGFDGPESRGYDDYWGGDWRVHVVRPA